MTDDALIADFLASEIWTKDAPMELVLRPITLFQLIGALQLARRHPNFAAHEEVATAVERFISAAREYFADCPTVLDVMDRGDDPAEDR